MTKQSFKGATEAEAQRHADEWIKSRPGITIRNRHVTGMSSGGSPQPLSKIVPESWIVTLEYDDLN